MSRRDLQALAGVTAVAAALRFATLDVQSYWFDEAVTAGLLKLGFFDMLGEIPDSESTPPLYYVLAWVWAKLFGTGEVGLRSLSALAGTATVPVAYLIAAEVANRRVGLMAAALVAVNPFLVWYSQEARAYALLVLLAALAVLFLVRALRGERNATVWWAVTSALALATHYFAVFVVAPAALWLLWRRRAAAPAAAVGAVGVALLPLAVDQASNRGAEFIEGSPLLTRIGQVPKQFLIGFDAPAEVAAGVLAGALVLAAFLNLARHRPRSDLAPLAPVAGVAAFGVGVPIALAIAGVDFLIARNLIAALVPALVVAAAGFALTREALVPGALLCALSAAIVIAVAAEPEYQRDDWRGAAEAAGPAREPRALVVTPIGGCVPLQLYLPGTRLIGPNGAMVTEVVLLGLPQERAGQDADPPRVGREPPYPMHMREVERVEEPTFTMVRYRANRPILVHLGPLQVTALGGTPPSVLVQEPGAAARACRPAGG
jgi:hypothetical protein